MRISLEYSKAGSSNRVTSTTLPIPRTFVSKVAIGKLKELGIEKASATVNSRPEKQKASVDLNIVFH
jgi:hypothetical protein